MKIEIKNRFSGSVIFSTENDSIKLAVLSAIKAGVSLRAADLRDADLSAADLSAADLSAADLSDANLRAADLSGANLRAANLSDANLCAAYLRGANLRDANLRDANLCAAYLRGANLSAANLRAAYLRGANLSAANLRDAYLRDANLSDADLRDANLSDAYLPALETISPVKNLDTQILEQIKKGGTLEMEGDWHHCKTSHCRAGWAITIHPHGDLLESLVGPAAAGALIYGASYPDQKVPNFFASNEEAMLDMQARSKKELAK